MNDLDFQDLQNQSNQALNRLTSASNQVGLSVNIGRNIKDIDLTSRYLNDSVSQKIEGIPINKDLISKYGLDNKTISRNLSNISASSITDAKIVPTDINSFLKSNFEAMIMSTIEQVQHQTIKQFEENHEQSTLSDWNKEKKRLEETLGQKFVKAKQNQDLFGGSLIGSAYKSVSAGTQGLGQSQQQSMFRPTGSQFMQQSTPSNIGQQADNTYYNTNREERTKLSLKMKNYSEVIKRYSENKNKESNEPSIVYSKSFKIVEHLSQVHCFENTDQRVSDSWNLIKMFTSESSTYNSRKESPSSITTVSGINNIRSQASDYILDCSIKFLEGQWFTFLKTKVPSNTNQSNPIELVASYLTSSNENYSNNQYGSSVEISKKYGLPSFAIIYHLLRSGCQQEAIDFLKSNNDILKRDEFISAIEVIKNGNSLPIEKKRFFGNESRISVQKDIFRSTVCQIFSNEHNTQFKLASSVQDYLWWKLFIIRENQLPIQIIQDEINEHIKNNAKFPDYDKFQWLLCTNQFENAIVFLSQHHEEDAVHFAIALQEYRLLQNPQPQPPFSSNEITNTQITMINFIALIKYYINRYFNFDIDRYEIFQYYQLFDKLQPNNRILAFTDLVVSLSSDRIEFISNVVHNQLSLSEYRNVLSNVAIQLDNRNDYISSMDVWLKDGEYLRVVEIFNSKISALLNSPLVDRKKLYDYGYNILSPIQQVLKNRNERAVFTTFQTLLHLCDYFNTYNESLYGEALSLLDQIHILPIQESEIENKSYEYRTQSPHISKNFSIILQSYIDILIKQYNLLNNSIGGTNFLSQRREMDQGTQNEIKNIIGRANTIYQFTGKIDFHLPGNSLSQLMNFIFTAQK